MEEKKLNVSIVDGKTFYAHEASINFNPTQFILDFKTNYMDINNTSKIVKKFMLSRKRQSGPCHIQQKTIRHFVFNGQDRFSTRTVGWYDINRPQLLESI